MVAVTVYDRSIKPAIVKLIGYCRSHNWAGYDPYDALNSKLLVGWPFTKSRCLRLALTQFMRRSPVNLRRCLLVPPTRNPKAIALFMMALIKLFRRGEFDEPGLIGRMADDLEESRSSAGHNRGWGYSFPWQTRSKIVPSSFPNLICTVFAANALMDYYELCHISKYLSMAVEAADFILSELYWEDGESNAGFAYPLPSMRSQVYNANLLGASLLARVYRETREARYLTPALNVARYSTSRQNIDGSWYYGENASQRWIDNFHTGYNLLALQDFNLYLGIEDFNPAILRGFNFYKANFFRSDGAPKYFHDRNYPIDAHCIAQSLLTLVGLKSYDPHNIPLADSVFRWAMTHMWDDNGYFYYQVHPLYKNRISYMRWSQAWMLLALSSLEGEFKTRLKNTC